MRDSNHLWAGKTSQTGKKAQEWKCAVSEPGNRSQPPPGSSRSVAEPAADPWSRESLRSTSGWSDHGSELVPISWICFGNHREAATAPGRAELHEELTGKAWPFLGKNTNFPCLPHFPSCAPSGALRALSGQVQSPHYPRKSQTRAQNSHTRTQEPLTDCNSLT